MVEFLRLLPPDQARGLLLDRIPPGPRPAEELATDLALGRVNAADIQAPHPLPQFARSSVDGYAVRAEDTFGATDSLPAYLQLIGEIRMGKAPPRDLRSGQCMLIHTGGMLPSGADAVVMLEHSQTVREAPGAENASAPSKATGTSDAGPGSAGPSESEVEILRAVAVGENTIDMGEDVREGQVVIPAGRLLRPADTGGLMALGITSLRVVKKPRVGLVSSGDEIVSASSQPAPGQVRDANAFGLAALVLEHGGEPINLGIVPDRLEALVDATTQAVRACDVLVISGGSSASARDYTADAIRVLGSPGILVHGVNVKPGKPTILAVCDGKPVLGLPGNPVSALIVARLFVVPVLELLLGLPVGAPRPRVPARLAINIASQAGREDWWPVRLLRGGSAGDVVVAEPIFAKSNLIFSLAASSGLIRVPESSTGIAAGEMVEVEIF